LRSKNEISEKPIASKGSENVKIAMKDIDEIVPPSKNEISEKPIASDGSQNVKIAIKDIDEIVPPNLSMVFSHFEIHPIQLFF
jgi:hypothetical protein